MPIRIVCSGCNKKLNAPDRAAGQKIRCPNCKTIVKLPAAQTEIALEPEQVLEPEPVLEPDLEELPADAYEPVTGGVQSAEVTPKSSAEPPRRPCPACGEMIPIQALKCRFCGEIFDATLKKAEEKKKNRRGFTDSGTSDDNLSPGEWVVAILCSCVGCIMGIIWMIQGKPKGIKMIGVSLLSSLVGGLLRAAAHH